MDNKSPFYYDKYAEDYDNLVYTVSSKDNTVIVKDYIREPLSASVTHNWTNEGGSIFSFWTNLMTSLASSSTFLDKMSDNLKTFLDQFGLLSDGEAAQSMSSFKAWTDYYKTYKGAVVNIPLTLQAILLRDGPCPAGTVNTPTGKLERILDYFAPETDSETSKYGVTFKPPHKYTPTITQAVLEAGTKIDGTLTLTYGPLIINNLLLSNFDYTISKERSRDGEPLYIAVNFSLIPALTFTKDHLPK